MNINSYDKALKYFMRFENSPQMAQYIINCFGAMGEFEKARLFREKFNQA